MRAKHIPIAAAIAIAIIVFLLARGVARGSTIYDGAIAIILIAPIALAIALVRPMVVPYSLYIALLPFDMFLSVSRVGTLTKILGITSGLLLLFFCLRTKRLVPPRLPLFVLGALLAWAAMTLLWTPEPAAATEPLQTLFGLVLLYVALSLAPIARSDFTFILGAIVAGYLAIASYGIATFHGVFSTALLNTDAPDRMILAMGSHYIDPNEFADALIFPLAATIMFGFRANYLTMKLLFLAIAGAMLTAIMLSGSREAIVAVAAVIVYYAWRSRHRVQLLAFTVIMALFAAPLFGSLSNRFQAALATGGAGRTSIWAVGLAAVKHYGLFGLGIGSFPIAYNRFYLSVPQTYLYGWDAPAHNVPLRYLVELGVIGLILVALFVAAHFVILRKIERDHPLHDFRVLMEAALLGLCVSAFFIDSFHSKWTWLVFATTVQLVNLASTHKRYTWTTPTLPDLARTPLPPRETVPVRVLPTSPSG